MLRKLLVSAWLTKSLNNYSTFRINVISSQSVCTVEALHCYLSDVHSLLESPHHLSVASERVYKQCSTVAGELELRISLCHEPCGRVSNT